MFHLPSDYTMQAIYQYAGFAEKTPNGLKASCPICHEGKHWGNKKRLYYFQRDDYIFCHNCVRSWTPFMWIKEVSGKDFHDIRTELDGELDDYGFGFTRVYDEAHPVMRTPTLPDHSINMRDRTQVLFYKDDFYVKKAASLLMKRRLLHAKFAPKAFYLSLTDKVHKGRLIIPYYDDEGKIQFYQSRALTAKQEEKAKYLSKINAEKYLFNLNRVDTDLDFVFLNEGALDCCFLQNAIGVSGVFLTDYQESLLEQHLPMTKKVWMLDNPRIDDTGREKFMEGALRNPSDLFFLWSDEFEGVKDINDYCIKNKLDFVPHEDILSKSVAGYKAITMIN